MKALRKNTTVSIVKVSCSSLFHEKQVTEMSLIPSVLRLNLGDSQASLLVMAADDPQLVLAGFEALIAARAKGARYVWAALFMERSVAEPSAAADPHLLALIGYENLLWV